MQTLIPNLSSDELIAICAEHAVRELGVFGSFARGEQRPESDLDILVEFQQSARVGYLAFFKLCDDLSDRTMRPVDLATKRSLRSPLRERILSEVKVLYAE